MKTILILFWGQSPEHEVSVRSARNVLSGIDKSIYEVRIVWVDQQWLWREFNQFPDGKEVIRSEKQFFLENERIDCIFSVIHGTTGEDWVIQGIATAAWIPIVWCWIASSELCIDKIKTKECLERNGISTAPYIVVTKEINDWWKVVSDRLWTPVFAKTPCQGSSVWVYKVENAWTYDKALQDCSMYDERVLLEKAIVWREIEFAVLGNDHILISPPWEIVQWDDWWYSYDDKYASTSNVVTRVVDDFSDSMVEKMRVIVTDSYKLLWCSGFARVDLFVTEDEIIYVNEVNTIPWFTSISMYPQLMSAAWVPLTQLLTRLIELACE